MSLRARLEGLKLATCQHQWMSQAEKLALIDVALAAERRREAGQAMMAAQETWERMLTSKANTDRLAAYDVLQAAVVAEDAALAALAAHLEREGGA